MKVFISWSGEESHKTALVLREWLPSVLQSIIPYVSSEDIDKGTRWASDIAGELDDSSFGLLCVTKENLNAPWLNFEAGALGKSVDKSRVCPFLFRLKRSEVSGPILQFQSTILEKDDIYKLLKAINEACDSEKIDESRLEKCFEVWWPSLESELNEIPVTKGSKPKEVLPENPTDKILEEILQLSRSNQMVLRNPEEILPEGYIRHVMRKNQHHSKDGVFRHPVFSHLISEFEELRRASRNIAPELKDNSDIADLFKAIDLLAKPMEFIERKQHEARSGRGEFDF